MKTDCNVAYVKKELMIVTKKIPNFNVTYFTSLKLFL